MDLKISRLDCVATIPNHRSKRQPSTTLAVWVSFWHKAMSGRRIASADSNTSGLIADALHLVFEAPEVSVSVTARRRFPLHVPRTRIRELQ